MAQCYCHEMCQFWKLNGMSVAFTLYDAFLVVGILGMLCSKTKFAIVFKISETDYKISYICKNLMNFIYYYKIKIC